VSITVHGFPKKEHLNLFTHGQYLISCTHMLSWFSSLTVHSLQLMMIPSLIKLVYPHTYGF